VSRMLPDITEKTAKRRKMSLYPVPYERIVFVYPLLLPVSFSVFIASNTGCSINPSLAIDLPAEEDRADDA